MGWKVKKEKIMNRVDYEKGGLNSVKVEEILNKFNNKIPTNTIINVCKEFDLINEIVKFDCRVEDVINEFLNIELEKEINNKKQINITKNK